MDPRGNYAPNHFSSKEACAQKWDVPKKYTHCRFVLALDSFFLYSCQTHTHRKIMFDANRRIDFVLSYRKYCIIRRAYKTGSPRPVDYFLFLWGYSILNFQSMWCLYSKIYGVTRFLEKIFYRFRKIILESNENKLFYKNLKQFAVI